MNSVKITVVELMDTHNKLLFRGINSINFIILRENKKAILRTKRDLK